MGKGQGALGPTGSNGPAMDDIADNNKGSIYQIAETRQNGANDAHVCIFNEDCIDATTDYGRLLKPFFHQNPKLLGLGKQFGQINFGAFRIFQSPKSQIFIFFKFVLQRPRDLAIVCP